MSSGDNNNHGVVSTPNMNNINSNNSNNNDNDNNNKNATLSSTKMASLMEALQTGGFDFLNSPNSNQSHNVTPSTALAQRSSHASIDTVKMELQQQQQQQYHQLQQHHHRLQQQQQHQMQQLQQHHQQPVLPPLIRADVTRSNRSDTNNDKDEVRQHEDGVVASMDILTNLLKLSDNPNNNNNNTQDNKKRIAGGRKNTVKKKSKMMPSLPVFAHTDYSQESNDNVAREQQQQQQQKRFNIPSLPPNNNNNAVTSATTAPSTATYFVDLPIQPNQSSAIPLKKRSKMSGGSRSGNSSSASSSIFSSLPPRLQDSRPLINIIHKVHAPPKKDTPQQIKLPALSSAAIAANNSSNKKKSKSKTSVALGHYKSECNSILKRCLMLAGYNNPSATNSKENKQSEDILTFYFTARAICDDIQRWKRLRSFFVQCQTMREAQSNKQQQHKQTNLDSLLYDNNKRSAIDDPLTTFSDATTKASSASSSIREFSTHNRTTNTTSIANFPTASPNLLTSLLSSNNNNINDSTTANNIANNNNNNDTNNTNSQDKEGDLSSLNNDGTSQSTHRDKDTVQSEFSKQLEDIDTVSEMSNFDTISELESKNSFLGKIRCVTSSVANINAAVTSVIRGPNVMTNTNMNNATTTTTSGLSSASRTNAAAIANWIKPFTTASDPNMNPNSSNRSSTTQQHAARNIPNTVINHDSNSNNNNKNNQENSITSSCMWGEGGTNASSASAISFNCNANDNRKIASKDNKNNQENQSDNSVNSNASSSNTRKSSLDHRALEWKSEFLDMVEDRGDNILTDLMTFSGA